MEKEEFKLDISYEAERFKNHLNITGNNKVIFSGIFGIGKTFFLKHFFEEENESYESITISPVNYSISGNDDIVEYIKYDIIFQLLSKGIDFDKMDFSVGLTSQMYLQDNFLEVMEILARNAARIDKKFGAVFNSLKEIKTKIEEHKDNVGIDEEKELIEFLTEIKDQKGSIYEENRISLLISKLITQLKEEDKEIVLVIDDTDRLDPEHIFRIFNVFANHFSVETFHNNKFDFDKVILVCDIDNIRKMFHSKYGLEVDFSGYIDKFYSKEIYAFDNKQIICNSLDELLDSVKNTRKNYIFKESKNWIALLKEILTDMVNFDVINLRSLVKISNAIYDFKSYRFNRGDSYTYNRSHQFSMFKILDFLKFIFGSDSNLETALRKLGENSGELFIEKYSVIKYGELVLFLDMDNYSRGDEDYTYENMANDLKISYTVKQQFMNDHVYGSINHVKTMQDNDRASFPVYKLLYLAYLKYKSLKIDYS